MSLERAVPISTCWTSVLQKVEDGYQHRALVECEYFPIIPAKMSCLGHISTPKLFLDHVASSVAGETFLRLWNMSSIREKHSVPRRIEMDVGQAKTCYVSCTACNRLGAQTAETCSKPRCLVHPGLSLLNFIYFQ